MKREGEKKIRGPRLFMVHQSAGRSRIRSLPCWTCLLVLFCLTAWSARAADDSMTVQGTGYPPVKAQNKAQALLMAKRAALLDAYRRALAGAERQGRTIEEGEAFYQGLSGFVKGLTVTREEYLSDGGVKIEGTVAKKDVQTFTQEKIPVQEVPKTKQIKQLKPSRIGGPAEVSIDQWYKIIEKMVKFESQGLKKGAE